MPAPQRHCGSLGAAERRASGMTFPERSAQWEAAAPDETAVQAEPSGGRARLAVRRLPNAPRRPSCAGSAVRRDL